MTADKAVFESQALDLAVNLCLDAANVSQDGIRPQIIL